MTLPSSETSNQKDVSSNNPRSPDVEAGARISNLSVKSLILMVQQRTILADVDYLDLDFVAKIVENFRNPVKNDENLSEEDELFRDRTDDGICQVLSLLSGNKP